MKKMHEAKSVIEAASCDLKSAKIYAPFFFLRRPRGAGMRRLTGRQRIQSNLY